MLISLSMVAELCWWCGRGSGGMKVVGCGVGGLWVLWHGFLLGCRVVRWLWRGGGVLAGHGSIWVVGCELGIGVDNVDVGWDRYRRRGNVWLGTTASFFFHSPNLTLLSSLTPIPSLKLGFGFGLIFYYRYRCICGFTVVAVGVAVVVVVEVVGVGVGMGSLWVYGGGHGFGWRLVKVWIGFNCCMGQIWWVCECCSGSVGVSVGVRFFNGGGWLVGWW